MQSTGQTSIQASQPVQLSARMTASSLGSFFLALPAALAMLNLPLRCSGPDGGRGTAYSVYRANRIRALQTTLHFDFFAPSTILRRPRAISLTARRAHAGPPQ